MLLNIKSMCTVIERFVHEMIKNIRHLL